MAIEFVCPTCNGTLQVGDDYAGRVIRCGGCQTMLRVPAADAGSAPSAPPSPFESAPPAPPPRPRRSDSPPPDEPRRRRDPYDDRPRRSRRQPPPSGGRGVFFWLVVVSLIAFFSVVACCGGILLLLPGAKWHTHESDRGGFRVELPGEVQAGVERAAGLKIDPQARSEGAILPKKGKLFAVLYRDVKSPKERVETDEQIIDKAIKDIQRAVAEKNTTTNKPITVSGFPGREVEIQGEKGWFAARIVVADSRLYILIAGGGFARPGDADVLRFLTSFEITDEKLLNEAQRRGALPRKKDNDQEPEDAKDKPPEKEPEKEPQKEKPPNDEKEPAKQLPVAPPPRAVDD